MSEEKVVRAEWRGFSGVTYRVLDTGHIEFSVGDEWRRTRTVPDYDVGELLARLAAENERLREENSDNDWAGEILQEIAGTLALLDKKHAGSVPGSTPPMFYREWIICCVAQREREIEKLKEALVKCLLPLEVLRMTECGPEESALVADVKRDVIDAVTAGRAALSRTEGAEAKT